MNTGKTLFTSDLENRCWGGVGVEGSFWGGFSPAVGPQKSMEKTGTEQGGGSCRKSGPLLPGGERKNGSHGRVGLKKVHGPFGTELNADRESLDERGGHVCRLIRKLSRVEN